MKKNLHKASVILFHFVDGKKTVGANNNMRGNCSGLRGDCSWIIGNIDSCDLSDEERECTIRIEELIAEGMKS